MEPKNARSTSNLRNERVERVVDFALCLAVGHKGSVHRRISLGPKGFQTEFDHFVNIQDMSLYGQTTCYKKRGTGGGEPNKTYEMRETLMEYLLVFLNGLKDNSINLDNVRFFHVVVGDPTYSYSYFHDIRKKSYDLNIVVNFDQGIQEFYNKLENLLPESIMKDDATCHLTLQNLYSSGETSLIKSAIDQIEKQFKKYIQQEFPSGEIGISLRKAIENLAESRLSNMEKHLSKTLKGAGIKEKYLKGAKGDKILDERIQTVVDKIFTLRPFLPEAKRALQGGTNGWRKYVDSIFENIPDDAEIDFALESLWNSTSPGRREISRRLLIKVPEVLSEKGVLYPQDIPIKGVTEHNLYGGEFDTNTTKKILVFIRRKFANVKILSIQQLKAALLSNGRQLIKSGFEYDIENGTVIRPTLYYLTNALTQKGYTLTSPKDALGNTIKGFHTELFGIDAGAFNNLQVILKSGIPLAIFKAKFFRPQEFDRRVKEEGFVSFMSYFKVKEGKLVPQLEHLPRIMFIDTIKDWKPDLISLEQLYLLGWDLFFDIDELLQYLERSYKILDKRPYTS